MQKNKTKNLKEIFAHDKFIAVLLTITRGEATYMSVLRWLGKESVVHTHNGILFSLKKEGTPVLYSNMDQP